MYEEIYAQAKQACNELCDVAKLKEGSIVVIGCSSSATGSLKVLYAVVANEPPAFG